MESLVVLHRLKKSQGGIPVESWGPKGPHALYWETCLRQCFICFGDVSVYHTEFDRYQGPEAYRFLLEVLCGLDSPLVGETEVLGQFKELISHGPKRPLFQNLLSDVKKIRSQHLVGIGSQSYGSILRRRISKGSRVHLIGTGLFAEEILPWVLKENDVSVLSRTEDRMASLRETFPQLIEEFSEAPDVLVVASNWSAQDIESHLITLKKKPRRIFDLRETCQSDPIASSANILTLNQLFVELTEQKRRLDVVLASVKRHIQACVETRALLTVQRPFGWEDLCG